MIKFKAYNHNKKTEFYGFGLSEINIQKLKEKKPIYIDGDKIDSLYDYLIFYGKTEDEMLDMFKDHIGGKTEVIIVEDD